MKTIKGFRSSGPIMAAAFAAAALSACSQPTNQQETSDASAMPDTSATTTPTSDASMAGASATAGDVQGYVMAAGSGDMFEIASSRIALNATRDQTVRAFAQRMIDDHTATTAALQTLVAQQPGVSLPTSMDARHAGMITQLEQAAKAGDRAAFDRLYMLQQQAAHQEAMTLHQGMASATSAPAGFQQAATQTLAKVQQHHSALQQMSAAGGSTTGSAGSAGMGAGGAGLGMGNSGSGAGSGASGSVPGSAGGTSSGTSSPPQNSSGQTPS